jgi:membrane protease YdiL (CAAX protease family)
MSPADRLAPVAPVAAGVLGLAGAVALRVGVAGADGVRSPAAGLLFALLLVALALGVSLRGAGGAGQPRRQLLLGLGGAAVLCAVPLIVHLRSPGGALPAAALPVWAVVVSAVAVAEEVLLRGALWQALLAQGELLALLVTSVAFALLHVPLYGWAALPLDLAVGLLLGGLRMASAGWGAPAVAHTLADLAGWWLR